MEQKFKLTKEVKIVAGRVVYRIEALRDTLYCKKGEKGGWLASENNLSQNGGCWVGNEACVYDFARVSGDAYISGAARIAGSSRVYAKGQVSGDAHIFGNAVVCEMAQVYDCASVGGHASVGGTAQIFGQACIEDSAQVYGGMVYENASIRGYAVVLGASIFGHASIFGEPVVGSGAVVKDYAVIHGQARIACENPPLRVNIDGPADIGGDAVVDTIEDFIVFKNWWSSGRYLTWTRSNKMWRVGCFYGEGDALVSKAYKKGDKCGREYERLVSYVESFLEEGH